MANVKYSDRFGAYSSLDEYYTPLNLQLQDGHTSKKATYIDSGSGNQIFLQGKNLDFNELGFPTEGSISKVTFANASDKPYIVAADAEMDAQDMRTALFTDGVEGLMAYAFRGKDKITGSNVSDNLYGYAAKDVIDGGKGNDYIDGGLGNDTLKGNKGSDEFYFTAGMGKDVIKDFDADGGGFKQDHLSLNTGEVFNIKKDGHDLLLKFDDGAILTLHDVDRSDFSRVKDVHYFEL